jgi:hypothetical protein
MAKIEESIEIKHPADKVFAYTTDAARWSKWQSIIPTAEQTSQGPVKIGSTFKGTARLQGLTLRWIGITTEYEPTAKYGKDITSVAMIIRQHNTYNPIDTGVKFTISYDVKVRGIFKLCSPVLVSSLRKELTKSLGNLKRILETQS